MAEGGLQPIILPLKPASLIIGNMKVTSETSNLICYTAHKQEAKEVFDNLKVLLYDQFEGVDWPWVHHAFHQCPKMFQLFASKQVFNVAAVLGNLANQWEYVHLGQECPSYTLVKVTLGHLLTCTEVGRIENLHCQLTAVITWLQQSGTNPELLQVLTTFLFSKGTILANGFASHTPPNT